jgi:hypothetical protein
LLAGLSVSAELLTLVGPLPISPRLDLDPAMKFPVVCALLLTVLPQTILCADETPSPEGVQFFESKIRPVLVEHCYQCHSAASLMADKLQGELLLDTRDGTRKGGESGPAIVPGDVGASALIAAIRHETFEMPPKSKLPKAVIDDFVKWVEMGAPDPRSGEQVVVEKKDVDVEEGKRFWSFQPLKNAAPPEVKSTDWCNTDIDRFILTKLEERSISPNTQAASRTLIRRLYFDLWGLPPESADVEVFVNDDAPDRVTRLVDRLLDGQHYGERWARHWLDLARFAESNGYAFDIDRPAAYHYRDFVIQALNDDMPYDEFVRLQVAGDLIDPLNRTAQAATGFLAAGTFTSQQTQKERERSRYEQLDDVVSTLGTTMLGLTIGCARCHDHKFDPLGNHDYYRLTASFAETGFQDYDWDSDPEGTRQALAAFDAEHKPFLDARATFEKDELPGRLAGWEAANVEPPPAEKLSPWQTIGPFVAADFQKAFDQKFGPEQKVDLTKPVGEQKWVEKPEWTDGVVHNTLTGTNAANYLFRVIEVTQKGPIDVSFGCDDGIKVLLNGKEVLSKPTMGGAAPDQHIVKLELNAGRNELLVKIVNGGGPSGFYFSSKGVVTPKDVQDVLNIAADKRDAAQQQVLLKWFAPRDDDWLALDKAEKEHLTKKPVPDITKIFAARKGGATYNFGADTRKVYFLARGNSNAKKGLASPAFLRVLMNSEQQEKTWLLEDVRAEASPAREARVGLANWLTDDQHGSGNLLARVIVNRLWQHHFGTGIVATPSDFGSQGTRPTHPELLDYLAEKLIAGGWKLKPIHRLIVTSAVYLQSGETSVAAVKVDPENQLLWRQRSRRMEAEIIRDNLLAVSGVLDKKMSGPGSLDEADVRRSVYLKVKRSSLIPVLQLFDAPDSIQSIGHRDVTTVPPQALSMMNSPLIRQHAERLAARIRVAGNTEPGSIVQAAYEMALSRPPEASELEQMTGFITSQANSYGTDGNAFNVAVTDYCQLMLCLNEFVYFD